MKKTTIRPTKDMTEKIIAREQMLALLQGDDAIRALLESTVQAVLEAMDEALGANRGERTADRRGYRSGHYRRRLITRVEHAGTADPPRP